METKELLKQVRQIEIKTKGLVNHVFSGEYHSIFKGRGMEFSEVREYQVGDDIRSIDWNVTARFGHPYIKVFEEERELTVMLIIDLSGSLSFGTVKKTKQQIAAELSAILAFSALKNNDKVGLIIFTDRIEKFVPPKKGKSHVLRVLRELLYFEPQGKGTDISLALEYLSRVTNRRAVVFLVSRHRAWPRQGARRDYRAARRPCWRPDQRLGIAGRRAGALDRTAVRRFGHPGALPAQGLHGSPDPDP